MSGKTERTDMVKSVGGRFIKLNKNRPPKDMAKELEKYKDQVFCLTKSGKLQKIWLNSLNDYNHSMYELHHFIQYQAYIQNPKWYKSRGIKQKLILVSKICHEHIEDRGIKVLSDEEFYKQYKINRKELLFRRNEKNDF